jgi:hypothetical protein
MHVAVVLAKPKYPPPTRGEDDRMDRMEKKGKKGTPEYEAESGDNRSACRIRMEWNSGLEGMHGNGRVYNAESGWTQRLDDARGRVKVRHQSPQFGLKLGRLST